MTSLTNDSKILLIGCGKMGGSMLKGWLASGFKAKNIWVVEPFITEELKESEVNLAHNFSELKQETAIKFNFCIIAVKPQSFNETLSAYKELGNGKCVFISIAAGKTISTMEAILGSQTPIARAMPNLPATIGAGITAIAFNANVTAENQKNITILLNAIGEVILLENESQLDAVTAISGSGPAYIFHLVESINNAGIALGLQPDVALALAKHTVYGSGKLALESTRSPEQLRIDVTSPGGTTEAALKLLMDDKKLEKLLLSAIKAAEERSKELGK